jgi:MerR family transcriptional regulator, light-induced transcriptional regulator
MPIISKLPAYNLKAVLKETGLKADVLRVWERRYELPKPHRTPGGHRLYSDYDIETVKWLRGRQAEGLSISRAVDLWKEIVAASRDPLVEYPSASIPLAPDRQVVETRIDILRQNWLDAILAFDSDKVDEILNQAFALYPVETVCIDILQQGISDLGNDWYLDKVSVQQEHFASALASRRLEALIASMPHPTRQQIVLVGCPSGEWHTFPTLILSLLLLRNGLKVVYLGADIPIEQLEETSAATRPDLVVLAAQQLATAATLRTTAVSLQRQGISLAYGGMIFNRVPGLREHIPAYFLGETLDGAVHMIERLVTMPYPLSTSIKVQEAYQELARLFQEKRLFIETALFERLQENVLSIEFLGEANSFFGNGLSAALELGDPAFMEADLEWVQKLLTGRQIPAERLIPYLAAYSQSVQHVIGDVSKPIVEWINSYVARNAAKSQSVS